MRCLTIACYALVVLIYCGLAFAMYGCGDSGGDASNSVVVIDCTQYLGNPDAIAELPDEEAARVLDQCNELFSPEYVYDLDTTVSGNTAAIGNDQ